MYYSNEEPHPEMGKAKYYPIIASSKDLIT